jgi:ribosome biogenesis GTPase
MQGIIIENISNLYKVKSNGTTYEATARGKFKKDDITPVVGDRVDIEIIENSEFKAVINEILPRNTYIKRPKISNITQIIFVVSTKNPKPDLLMLDKQLAYAEFLGINSAIILNKIDLDNTYLNIKELYEKIGYKVILTNAKELQGIDEVKQILKNNVSVFSGNSGVGKSTLINSLFSSNITQEGEISQKNKKGKNTTTTVKLYDLGNESYIADTPGFSNFSIEEIESKDLEKYFIEFKPYIDNCAFVGCTHIKEEDCGIKKAIKENKISKDRYERFCYIYNELKDKEERRW